MSILRAWPRIGLIAAISGALAAGPLQGQASPAAAAALDSARHAADEARHGEAARYFRAALALDPDLRPDLVAPLGRQLLWSGDAPAAVHYLQSYLAEVDASDLGVRLHLAHALTWSDRLNDALEEYRRILSAIDRFGAEAYPDGADILRQASLGAARALRWQGRMGEAEGAYRSILAADPTDLEATQGLALTLQDTGRPREAMRLLESVGDEPLPHQVTATHARIRADLGRPQAALAALDRQLPARAPAVAEEARADLRRRLRPTVELAHRGSRDSDGLAHDQTRIEIVHPGAGHSLGIDLMLAVGIERTAVAGLPGVPDEPLWRGQAGATVMPSDAFRLATRLDAIQGYGGKGGSPLLAGEANLTWLPADRRRFDLGVARLPILDHPGAIADGFVGHLLSAGTDQPLGRRASISLAGDVTRWDTRGAATGVAGIDAVRTRLRGQFTLPFRGNPAITATWPTLIQRYNAPLPLGFYSPRLYVESGPAIDVYRRLPGPWHVWAEVRVGGQAEWDPSHEGPAADAGGVVRPLGRLQASIERELSAWEVGIHGSWTNSNLTGDRGFERAQVRVEVRHRL